jgi:hypothetical protein
MPKSATVRMHFAFPVDGNKWHVKTGTVIYRNGFLNGLGVDEEDISQSFGPHGMSTSFTFLGRTRLKDGKLIGDIYGMTYNDGQLITDVLVAEGVEIASEENYGVDESVVKHGLRSGLPSSPSRNGRSCDGSMQEQDARASNSLTDSREDGQAGQSVLACNGYVETARDLQSDKLFKRRM